VKLWQRALVAVLLLSALSGLFVHAEVTSDARSPYPAPHELAADYDSYVGETVLVFGRVTAASGETLTIDAESEGVTIELRVDEASASVTPGGTVQVYGELQSNQSMAAQQVVVVNESGGAEWYKYAVSAFGAIGFLVAFGRYWRIDTETWTVEGRDG
jgi:hypothetical protein